MRLGKIIITTGCIITLTSATSVSGPHKSLLKRKSEIELPSIEIVGSKFFNSKTGEQFFMKGIAYQPSRTQEELEAAYEVFNTKYIDPLAETDICKRDIPYLTKLGINTIRVYSIDPTKSHDTCMEAMAENGIYVLLDLSEPDKSITREEPNWDIEIHERYKSVVDSMQKYSNVLGFFAGNEVTNDKTNTDASPFVKASIRDIKNYIKEKGYRPIPVGYSTNDDPDTREALADYFICGEVAADFYGVNMYEWCGYSSYGTSGYRERTREFKDYPIPVFFSEFGCNSVRPRPFTEVAALYGRFMTPVWSGGLAYMYFEEENEYGVVKVTKNNQVVELEDFRYLQNEFEKANPKGITKEGYLQTYKKGEMKARKCPSSSTTWKATENIPQTPSQVKCSCLDEILPCLVVPLATPAEHKNYFDYVCNEVDCSDIKADGNTGVYGEFSDCSAGQKLALQISKMYFKSGSVESQCPLSDRNVYFNFKNKDASQKSCSKVLKSVKNLASHEAKGIQKDKLDDKGSKNISTSSSGKIHVSLVLAILSLLTNLRL